MSINGDGNWVNLLNEAVVTYNINIHCTKNMSPFDVSNHPEKVRCYISTSTKMKRNHKVGEYVRSANKRNM